MISVISLPKISLLLYIHHNLSPQLFMQKIVKIVMDLDLWLFYILNMLKQWYKVLRFGF